MAQEKKSLDLNLDQYFTIIDLGHSDTLIVKVHPEYIWLKELFFRAFGEYTLFVSEPIRPLTSDEFVINKKIFQNYSPDKVLDELFKYSKDLQYVTASTLQRMAASFPAPIHQNLKTQLSNSQTSIELFHTILRMNQFKREVDASQFSRDFNDTTFYMAECQQGHILSSYLAVNDALCGRFKPLPVSVRWGLETLRKLNTCESHFLVMIEAQHQKTFQSLIDKIKARGKSHEFADLGIDLAKIPKQMQQFDTLVTNYITYLQRRKAAQIYDFPIHIPEQALQLDCQLQFMQDWTALQTCYSHTELGNLRATLATIKGALSGKCEPKEQFIKWALKTYSMLRRELPSLQQQLPPDYKLIINTFMAHIVEKFQLSDIPEDESQFNQLAQDYLQKVRQVQFTQLSFDFDTQEHSLNQTLERLKSCSASPLPDWSRPDVFLFQAQQGSFMGSLYAINFVLSRKLVALSQQDQKLAIEWALKSLRRLNEVRPQLQDKLEPSDQCEANFLMSSIRQMISLSINDSAVLEQFKKLIDLEHIPQDEGEFQQLLVDYHRFLLQYKHPSSFPFRLDFVAQQQRLEQTLTDILAPVVDEDERKEDADSLTDRTITLINELMVQDFDDEHRTSLQQLKTNLNGRNLTPSQTGLVLGFIENVCLQGLKTPRFFSANPHPDFETLRTRHELPKPEPMEGSLDELLQLIRPQVKAGVAGRYRR